MISKEIRGLLDSGSDIRWAWEEGLRLARAHGAGNLADMTLGNPTVPPPPELLAALEEVVAHPPDGLHRYTPNAGDPEVRERIAHHLDSSSVLPGARRHHVLVTSGASAAINAALRAVLDPGDEVVILAPYFPDYPAHALNHQGVPVIVPTRADFLPDLGAVERALGPRSRVVIVNHPNNPSGRQYPLPLLDELVELVRRRSRANNRVVYLLSDEPYRVLRYTDEPFVSPARLSECGLMTYSFSKSHSIPGERIGYLAVNPAMPELDEVVAALTLSTRILGFTHGPSLWQHVIARCLDAVVDLAVYRRHRERLLAALEAKGYQVSPPDGAFYFFPPTPGGDDRAFVERARDRLLLLVAGAAFGRPGHFRMAYCVDDRTVDLAVERLPEAV